jgi:hypothetical protein
LYRSPRLLPPGMSLLHYQSDESTKTTLKVMILTESKLHAKMTGNPHNNMSKVEGPKHLPLSK